ncbi:hypothetical protein PVMG_05647 [Plasmodium vivax Mauritania I]|uniref:Uncharacterized protein n=1 Tax=Plasmodium vivax Mauritania I TaxID=1035515 RepID=A0A0J9W3T4_PLAVI|nr:hypothetical protein PVMG_05647 [Plasmodium vivax Mauritania I]
MSSQHSSRDFIVIYICVYYYELLYVNILFNILFYIIRINKIQLFQSSPKELNSEKFYDALDSNSTDLTKYDQKCNNIQVNRNDREKMIPICKKYLRFLDTSKSWDGIFWKFDVSLLLNYWLYDKITHIYGTTESHVIGIGFGALQGIWDTFDSSRRENSYYKKCKPDPDKVKHDDWVNRKKLYDYYVDFDTLYGNGSAYDEICRVYYQKIKEIIPVCKYFEGKCISKSYSCPDNYNKCKEKNLETALEELPCHKTIKDRIGSTSEDSSSYQPPGPAERPPGPAVGPEAVSNIQLEGGNSRIGTKVTHSVLGAAPVLLTATMLYRVCIYFINIYRYSKNL